MTVATTAKALSASRLSGPRAAVVKAWKESPTNTNRMALIRKTSVCQKTSDCRRVAAEKAPLLLCQPR